MNRRKMDMKETFITKNGVTIEVNVTRTQGVNVAGENMELPKGTKMVAENMAKGIRYEYVDTESLVQRDFEGVRPKGLQKELQELILTEGFPYQGEVGNFWAGVPEVSDNEAFSCEMLANWAEYFDRENGSCMGNIHQYALYLASRVKVEGWESVVAEKSNRIYKRYRIIKDDRTGFGFSRVGGCSNFIYVNDEPSSRILTASNTTHISNMIIAWIVLPK